MNIALISVTASFHHLAKKFEKEPNVSKIVHYGANINLKSTEKYFPIPFNLSYVDNMSDEDTVKLLDDILLKRIDLVLTSHLSIAKNKIVHEFLKKNNIAYFFPEPNLISIEFDRLQTKRFLSSLNIPFSKGKKITSNDLYQNFFNYKRPFVIKLNCFMHGRQTIIVDENNFQDVYYDLFSIFIDYKSKITNIGLDNELILEKYVELKTEYSFLTMINQQGWKYFGTAKDYKKAFDGNTGHNTIGMGAINFEEVDPIIHKYMDKIFIGLQKYLKSKNQHYKGFMFLNIGITLENIPIILEINTRAGEPEIDVIIETIENNLSEIFYLASTDQEIPDIIRNDNKVSCVRVVDKKHDWLTPIFYSPRFNFIDVEEIDIYFQGTDGSGIYHSLIIGKDNTHLEASDKIYKYLEKQDLRGFYYRKDIGK